MIVFPAQYSACPECGANYPQGAEHVCDEERRLDFQIVKLRPKIAKLECDLGEWLGTLAGRFEIMYAERTRP